MLIVDGIEYKQYLKTGYYVNRIGTVINSKGRLIKHWPINIGHNCVSLFVDDKNIGRTVHSLVCRAWIGKRPEG